MDNTLGYELSNGGSIPSGGTRFRMLTANKTFIEKKQNSILLNWLTTTIKGCII